MKLYYDIVEKCFVIGEVFSGAVLETAEGNRVGFCMRDDTIELNVMPKSGGDKWFRIDMQNFDVYSMGRHKSSQAGSTETQSRRR